MLDLTFGEQVKIILSRRGMTIKELAEKIETETGKKMSRQNLTQRLGRDNFQEQDMRMIAQILGCPFYLDILEEHEGHEESEEEDQQIENLRQKKATDMKGDEKETPVVPGGYMTSDVAKVDEVQEEKERLRTELDEKADSDFVQETLFDYVWNKEAQNMQTEDSDAEKEDEKTVQEEKKKAHGWRAFFEKYIKHEAPEMEDTYETEREETVDSKNDMTENDEARIASKDVDEENPDDEMFLSGEEDLSVGELNPYTGHEYESNSVRMNKKRIGYVQVYDRGKHQWMDMTEWAFLGYQERKKALLGKDYVPPIYLD